jgi:hypothetical protein
MVDKNELQSLNHKVKLDKEQALEDRDRALADKERSRKVNMTFYQEWFWLPLNIDNYFSNVQMTEAIKKDLELVSARCTALEEENEDKKSELEKIKALQVIVDQNHSMEQTMQSKVRHLCDTLLYVQSNS